MYELSDNVPRCLTAFSRQAVAFRNARWTRHPYTACLEYNCHSTIDDQRKSGSRLSVLLVSIWPATARDPDTTHVSQPQLGYSHPLRLGLGRKMVET